MLGVGKCVGAVGRSYSFVGINYNSFFSVFSPITIGEEGVVDRESHFYITISNKFFSGCFFQAIW